MDNMRNELYSEVNMVQFDGFDWDDSNSLKSLKKHGVVPEVVEGFFHKKVWVAPDPTHSHKEDRFIAIGQSNEGRPMFVAFTFRLKRGLRLIRPISARYMHVREVKKYEKVFAKTED